MSLLKEAGLDPTLLHRRTYTKYLNAMGFKHEKRDYRWIRTKNQVSICLRHEKTHAIVHCVTNKVEGVAKAWGGTSVDSQRQQRTRWWKALASDGWNCTWERYYFEGCV